MLVLSPPRWRALGQKRRSPGGAWRSTRWPPNSSSRLGSLSTRRQGPRLHVDHHAGFCFPMKYLPILCRTMLLAPSCRWRAFGQKRRSPARRSYHCMDFSEMMKSKGRWVWPFPIKCPVLTLIHVKPSGCRHVQGGVLSSVLSNFKIKSSIGAVPCQHKT